MEKPVPTLHVLQKWAYALIGVIAVGWLLYIGQTILMPILVAAITVYVLVTAAEWLGRVPLIGALPEAVRRLLVMVVFVLIAVALAMVVVSAVGQLVSQAPEYQANLQSLANTVAGWFGTQAELNWDAIREATINKLDIGQLLGQAFGGVSALLGGLVVVIVYAIFLLGERVGFSHKLALAMDRDDAETMQRVIGGVNQQIGRYLAIKTLVNVIFAAGGFVVLLAFGVDMPLFWAIILGLLNYIPYVGAFLGAVLPILMTLLQFGSVEKTIFFAVLLIGVQTVVGNFIEPRMVGRTVNMSPFVVLASLTLWSALWGVPGAILAIPMTAVIMIICSSFPATRGIAVMLSQDPDKYLQVIRDQTIEQAS